jgi:hypothetical protein
VKRRLIRLATEPLSRKAERATRESCQAWSMLFEIIDAPDPADAAQRIATSPMLARHRVYWEAHRLGDKANARLRRRRKAR